MTKTPASEQSKPDTASKKNEKAPLDEAIDESFPASDPPGWTSSIAIPSKRSKPKPTGES